MKPKKTASPMCNTPWPSILFTASQLERLMRHTPAFVFIHRFAIGTATGSSFSPLREGMARQRYIDNQIDNQNDAAAHPLSERGGRRPGCVAPSNIDNPGVSHRQTSTIRCVSHRQASTILVCRIIKHRQSWCVAPSSIDNPGCVALSSQSITIIIRCPSGLYACYGGFARLTIGNDIGHR